MPELPEVETVRCELAGEILQKPIAEIKFWRKNLRYILPAKMPKLLKGKTFTNITRRGKYLLFSTDSDWLVIAHLGMSGNFTVHANYRGINEVLPHRHVDIAFADGSALIYCDPRRFGFIDLCKASEAGENKHLKNMGVEPLSDEFGGDYLHARTKVSKKPIKNLLLDQAVIAGIGNIYACEALFMSGISPLRKSHKLSRVACEKLSENIRATLIKAIDKGGSSMRDFRNTSGDLGYFQHEWLCYGKEGDACSLPNCAGVIRRISQSGRSSFYCPKHQR